jgi:hypothetical protein
MKLQPHIYNDEFCKFLFHHRKWSPRMHCLTYIELISLAYQPWNNMFLNKSASASLLAAETISRTDRNV